MRVYPENLSFPPHSSAEFRQRTPRPKDRRSFRLRQPVSTRYAPLPFGKFLANFLTSQDVLNVLVPSPPPPSVARLLQLSSELPTSVSHSETVPPAPYPTAPAPAVLLPPQQTSVVAATSPPRPEPSLLPSDLDDAVNFLSTLDSTPARNTCPIPSLAFVRRKYYSDLSDASYSAFCS